jgi:hypothetical protein
MTNHDLAEIGVVILISAAVAVWAGAATEIITWFTTVFFT